MIFCFYAQIIRRQFTGFNMKKREVKLTLNRDASSEPVIEVNYKLRQPNGWEVYNEGGELEVRSTTFICIFLSRRRNFIAS